MSLRECLIKSGSRFECIVSSTIHSIFLGELYLNVKFFSPSINRGTECDIIFVTNHAVYCIECKNYRKFISGSYLDLKWSFSSDGRNFKDTINGFIENDKHVRILNGLLRKEGIKDVPIFNLICVPDTCTIKSDCLNVKKLSDLIIEMKYLEEINKKIDFLKVKNAIENVMEVD